MPASAHQQPATAASTGPNGTPPAGTNGGGPQPPTPPRLRDSIEVNRVGRGRAPTRVTHGTAARTVGRSTGKRAALSIHLSRAGGAPRRVVLSCDMAGCPIQVEPPAIEAWRSDADAQSWARDQAVGWTWDPVRQTDYCPEHAEFGTAPAADAVRPRPTATARDRSGNPLNRDEYAAHLRAQLADASRSAAQPPALTAAQAAVVARLLDELSGVYRDEDLGTLARELSRLLGRQLGERD